MSIRVGGILVPVFALLAGCSASAGGSGSSGSTENALASADHGKPVHGGEDAAPPCDDAGTPPPSTPPTTPPSDPPCDDAGAPPPPVNPPCDDAGTTVTPDAAPPSPPATDAGETCSVDGYDGRATGLDVKLGVTLLKLDGDLALSDTGPLPAAGGTVTAHVLNLTEATLASVGVLDAQSTGASDATTSTVSVTGLGLHIPGLGILPDLDIGANVLAAHAVASCDAASASTHGGADIAGLSIAGKAIVVTGFPNQTIDLGVGKIIINEIIKDTTSQSQGEIQVAALHVSIPNVADVVVSAASAGITCSCEEPAPVPPVINPPDCTASTDCRKGQACYNGHCATID